MSTSVRHCPGSTAPGARSVAAPLGERGTWCVAGGGTARGARHLERGSLMWSGVGGPTATSLGAPVPLWKLPALSSGPRARLLRPHPGGNGRTRRGGGGARKGAVGPRRNQPLRHGCGLRLIARDGIAPVRRRPWGAERKGPPRRSIWWDSVPAYGRDPGRETVGPTIAGRPHRLWAGG